MIRAQAVPVFDAKTYLRSNPDVHAAGEDALRHYLSHGWREDRAPNSGFDPQHYRAVAGLSLSVPVSPLAHYLAIGAARGLPTVRAVLQSEPPEDPGKLCAAILDLPVPQAGSPVVDVLMPVHDGHAETLSAILHVLSAQNRTEFELTAIDDCGPDPALRRDLAQLAESGRLRLVRNDRNKGFVASINTGMRLHPDRDVIWLNADTEVFDGWIDRLRRAAYSRAMVATVTPLTNNGTICSYPRIDADNPVPAGTEARALDRITATENAGETVETPTAVGFATYVRRAAIEAIGPLDEAAFGRGYGEENDFSQRAVTAGWCNLIAADIFVRHLGGRSFGAERRARIDRAMDILDHRYPCYHRAVQRFLREDPLFECRRRLDRARLLALRGTHNALMIGHSLGGGTEQHLREEAARLRKTGWSVFLLRGGANGEGSARLGHLDASEMPALDTLDLAGPALWDLLHQLDLSLVQIHHLIDFGKDAAGLFADRLPDLGTRAEIIVHDYYAVCPRINLADRAGMYCGEPDPPGCQRCLRFRGSPVGVVNIARWRETNAALLRRADQVRVPDVDVAKRLARYVPGLNCEIRPHDQPTVPASPARARRTGPIRIGTIGAIGAIKGFDVLLDLAAYLRTKPERATLIVVGYTRCDETARQAGIHVTGRYRNEDLVELLRQADLDAVLLPSLWPETYSYTLSYALGAGLPVIAFDLGAIASRLRAAGHGRLVPLSDARDPESLLQAIEEEVGRPPLNATG